MPAKPPRTPQTAEILLQEGVWRLRSPRACWAWERLHSPEGREECDAWHGGRVAKTQHNYLELGV